MAKKRLTENEWDQFVKETFKSFAHAALPNRGDNAKAAKALNLSLSAIEQMKSSGKGSPKSWIKLAAFSASLDPDDIRNFFENLPSLLRDFKPLSEVDSLFEEMKCKYSSQEIAALMQLLLAKKEIEEFVGVDIKVSNKKKTSKK